MNITLFIPNWLATGFAYAALVALYLMITGCLIVSLVFSWQRWIKGKQLWWATRMYVTMKFTKNPNKDVIHSFMATAIRDWVKGDDFRLGTLKTIVAEQEEKATEI